jgi:hypothetical protein
MPKEMGMSRETGKPKEMGMSRERGMSREMGMVGGGHLYMQTNETQNAVIHFRRHPDGTITEVDRTSTGGSGSGLFKPISNEESAPNAFEGANSVILSPDRRFLFATNGGDNSVSCFAVGEDGRLTLLDVCSTGNSVEGRSGTAKALVYGPSTGMLYVLHGFGPDHLRLMSVDDEGKLTLRPERYTVNTHNKLDRVSTMATLSPDGRLLFVGTTWDEPPAANPDGSPIIWVPRTGRGPGFALKSIASNAPDPDGLIVFPVNEDGTLSPATYYDGHGASPWNIRFLNGRPDTFIIGYAVGDGISIGHINTDGTVSVGEVVKIDTTMGRPAELCWLSISPDDRTVYATDFGYGYLTTFHIDGSTVSVAKDPACPRVPGDGTFRALCGDISSGPSDSWISSDGAYLYQIYGNASKLVSYAVQPDGSLREVGNVRIPYNSPQGLVGFDLAA